MRQAGMHRCGPCPCLAHLESAGAGGARDQHGVDLDEAPLLAQPLQGLDERRDAELPRGSKPDDLANTNPSARRNAHGAARTRGVCRPPLHPYPAQHLCNHGQADDPHYQKLSGADPLPPRRGAQKPGGGTCRTLTLLWSASPTSLRSCARQACTQQATQPHARTHTHTRGAYARTHAVGGMTFVIRADLVD